MLKALVVFIFCGFSSTLWAHTSVTTSLSDLDCQIVEENLQHFTSKSLCPGIDPVTVYVKTNDVRRWLELVMDQKVMDLSPMLLKEAKGLAPEVGDEVSWYFSASDQNPWIIFSVRTQHPHDLHRESTSYWAIKLTTAGAVFLGQASTKREAEDFLPLN